MERALLGVVIVSSVIGGLGVGLAVGGLAAAVAWDMPMMGGMSSGDGMMGGDMDRMHEECLSAMREDGGNETTFR